MAKTKVKTVETSLAVYSEPEIEGNFLALAPIPEAQKQVLADTSGKMTSVDLQVVQIENEIRMLQADIKSVPDPRYTKIEDLKKKQKRLKEGKKELVQSLGGIMKMALAEVPGETLLEKYKFLENKGKALTNGRISQL